MLNHLKQAIRKRKLYFTVKYSIKNINELSFLLTSKLITSFVSFKRSSIIVLINYNHDFNASITSISSSFKKLSKQQNKTINCSLSHSNFIINTHLTTNPLNTKSMKKATYFVKFR